MKFSQSSDASTSLPQPSQKNTTDHQKPKAIDLPQYLAHPMGKFTGIFVSKNDQKLQSVK
ncbi:hypothetical protein C0081_08425 [Cohaesibacter celericrescens]|uniref:Uncharacterized protein n=1 Tax=Cohaesibacter celericrescens TaxID=2067669 RepID=A0A2N5XSG6_9HYPH|nr:hypothetical protein C0081_08425 [Cohaesibacter celericrescens]